MWRHGRRALGKTAWCLVPRHNEQQAFRGHTTAPSQPGGELPEHIAPVRQPLPCPKHMRWVRPFVNADTWILGTTVAPKTSQQPARQAWGVPGLSASSAMASGSPPSSNSSA